MLAGRVDRAGPFGWRGEHATLEVHLAQTFKNLGGRGLEGDDLHALVAWVRAMPAPPRAPSAAPPDRIARGKKLFASTDTGCGACHREADGFSDHEVHDVTSATAIERKRSFVTPSLRFVAGTTPYFHDGRYATLAELLRKSEGMGATRGLTSDDLDALEAYLQTL
jgi:hypothetical protein